MSVHWERPGQRWVVRFRDEPFRHGGLTLLTGMFIHAGVFHLLFNLYFLVVFGDNVEDQLGKGQFLLLLLGSHLTGCIFHALWDPRGSVPCVGASAAIAGAIAYYAVAFPHARIGFFLRYYYVIFRWVRLRAIWWLVMFIFFQTLGAYRQVLGLTNVSALAHLGGLAVGLAIGVVRRVANRMFLSPSAVE